MEHERKFIAVELPRNWKEIDPNHMYHVLNGFTFHSDIVTQAEHDVVAILCVALEKLTGREIKSENPSSSKDPVFDNLDNVKEIERRVKNIINEGMEEAWDKMGDTGNDEYQKKINSQNYYFGRYRAFEDIQDFINIIKNGN